MKSPGQGDQSINQEVEYSSEEDQVQDTIQMKILAELSRVNDRLDDVETWVTDNRRYKESGDKTRLKAS